MSQEMTRQQLCAALSVSDSTVREFPTPSIDDAKTVGEFMAAVRAGGGKTTDGVVDLETFSEGWAKACFVGNKVHYWRRYGEPVDAIVRGQRMRFYPVLSLCGLDAGPDSKTPLMGGGNYPRCKRCERKV